MIEEADSRKRKEIAETIFEEIKSAIYHPIQVLCLMILEKSAWEWSS